MGAYHAKGIQLGLQSTTVKEMDMTSAWDLSVSQQHTICFPLKENERKQRKKKFKKKCKEGRKKRRRKGKYSLFFLTLLQLEFS